jgi:NitT/TauT family transport system substrate-binding protein
MFSARPSLVEVSEISIALQFGASFLPPDGDADWEAVEKQAERVGIGPLKVTCITFGSGADMNVALISGTLDFASGGVGPLSQIWDRTKDNLAINGVAAFGSLPLYLNTINPKIRTIKDFTDGATIALPVGTVSIQAVVLQMAPGQAFGDAKYDSLDGLTISLNHPQATAALLSGTEITAHFSNAPFQVQELKDPRVRQLLSSYDVFGGPAPLVSLYAASKVRRERPKVYGVLVVALREAMALINRDKDWAAKIYIEEERSNLDPELVHSIISNPEVNFGVAPQGFMKFADFMLKTKAIKCRPSSW